MPPRAPRRTAAALAVVTTLAAGCTADPPPSSTPTRTYELPAREVRPDEQPLRVVVTNTGRSTVLFDAKRQRLVLEDGSTHRLDGPATLVKRQPEQFDLGSSVRVEFDLYFDVPAGAEPKALRAFGGPTLTDMSDEQGTDIPLG